MALSPVDLEALFNQKKRGQSLLTGPDVGFFRFFSPDKIPLHVDDQFLLVRDQANIPANGELPQAVVDVCIRQVFVLIFSKNVI